MSREGPRRRRGPLRNSTCAAGEARAVAQQLLIWVGDAPELALVPDLPRQIGRTARAPAGIPGPMPDHVRPCIATACPNERSTPDSLHQAAVVADDRPRSAHTSSRHLVMSPPAPRNVEVVTRPATA